MIIDVHCHFALSARRANVAERFSFEPATHDGAPTFDSYLAPRVLQRAFWRLWRRMLGINARLPAGDALDLEIEHWLLKHLVSPGPVDRFVLLAFDDYHDRDGRRPPPPTSARDRGGDMYTSNTFVRDLCRRFPQRFLFGASVHPYRENAVACVDEVFAGGASLLKWLPLHQNIDCADPRSIAVLRRCGQLGLPVLIHHGPEFTLKTQHPEFIPVAPLLDVLRDLRREGTMPTVIVAHVATPILPFGDERHARELCAALLDEFAEAPLYADVSALTTWGKIGWLRRLARWQELHNKLLFGTDFPVPLGMLRLWRDLGHAYRRIAAEPSWPQRVAHIYRHLGFNEIVFHRAATLLPNQDYFGR